MTERRDPWKEMVEGGYLVRGRYVGIAETLSTARDLARHHCQGRNHSVASVLCHLVMMRQTGVLPDGHLGISGAEFQMPLSERRPLPVPGEVTDLMNSLGLGADEQREIRDKCYTTQDAHRLPCQIVVGSTPLPDAFLRPGAAGRARLAHAAVAGMFAAVDRLPTMFNETDSHAELLGLKDAFVSACRLVLDTHALTPAGLTWERLERGYRHYVLQAVGTLQSGVQRNQQLGARPGAGFVERFYRRAKAGIMAIYEEFTASERPDLLRNPVTLRLFGADWAAG